MIIALLKLIHPGKYWKGIQTNEMVVGEEFFL